jgi:hypothetical protein
MPWSYIIPAAVGLFASNQQAGAAKDAASAANEQQDKALALQTRMYDEGIARQQPYSNIGLEFTNRLADMQRNGAGAGVNMLNMDPGYNFRLGEGLKSLDRQSAARGGLISGGALKAAQRYGQDYASNEFGNAYNRMAGLASLGPSSAGVMNNLGSSYSANAGNTMGTMGANTGNALLSAANSRASAYTGAGNQFGKYLSGNGGFGGVQASFSQTGMGGSGFGSGLAYGNQDLGSYL